MKANSYVFFLALVAALGGFLFGFDTAVISGAERYIQSVWQLDDLAHGVTIAIALYGTVLGALIVGKPANKYGRKPLLISVGILYTVSALGSALAPEVNSFMFFRFLGGIGVGASSVIAPMYISEIAPAKNRGMLVALFQFNLVFGILIAYVSNYFIEISVLTEGWRWMLGIETLPAIIYTLLSLRVPESPRWLINQKGDYTKAEAILTKTDPEGVAHAIEMATLAAKKEKQKSSFKELFNQKYFKISLMAILIAFFNQLSGINAIIYFAPRIFEMANISTEQSLLSTMGVGAINIIFTMVGLSLIDKFGRKKLLYIGCIGYITSLLLMSISFAGDYLSSSILPFFVFGFIASHAIGSGCIIWTFISEIFPNHLRSYGQSLGSLTHWVFAALIANIFPYVANTFGASSIFLFFSGMMVIQLIWAVFKMPETKGRSLEDINQEIS